MRQLNLRQLFCCCLVTVLTPFVSAADLTLAEIEQAALREDPSIQRNESLTLSLSQTATADGQLSDPNLTVGVFNVPNDDFDLNKNPTTQLRFGLKQDFPKGNTLALKQAKGKLLALAKKHQIAWLKRKILLEVRLYFFEALYHQGAVDILNKNRSYFVDLLKTTENFYEVGRANQQDILLAELELSRLDDRLIQSKNLLSINKAVLAKWIPSASHRKLNNALPKLTTIAELQQIENALIQHPKVLMDDAFVKAAKQTVSIAQEQYKPGFNVGVEYRKRFGDEPNGQARQDMVAAMVSVNMPLFPEKRQDKRLMASQYNYQSAKLQRLDDLTEMRQQLNQQYGNWLRLSERANRYQTVLLKQASENTKAALHAYQAGVADFSTLIQARITALEISLQSSRLNVDKTKVQARILFYSAVPPQGEQQ